MEVNRLAFHVEIIRKVEYRDAEIGVKKVLQRAVVTPWIQSMSGTICLSPAFSLAFLTA